ncbi:hypothetical protein C2845_PM01G03920 [Panicum miliaceum]|uniref:Uncharacterized protein n=1 Tax=Panicum miliaceum TaxID=4540 RepID=A0A3L6TQT5_PANMI|nr:hypothetical protein C2845_PM01G03920 [Panicum miliaceum]
MAAANGESDETSGLATPLNHVLAQGAYGNASFVYQRKPSLVTQKLISQSCLHGSLPFTEVLPNLQAAETTQVVVCQQIVAAKQAHP